LISALVVGTKGTRVIANPKKALAIINNNTSENIRNPNKKIVSTILTIVAKILLLNEKRPRGKGQSERRYGVGGVGVSFEILRISVFGVCLGYQTV
jgi:hypothetical protein